MRKYKVTELRTDSSETVGFFTQADGSECHVRDTTFKSRMRCEGCGNVREYVTDDVIDQVRRSAQVAPEHGTVKSIKIDFDHKGDTCRVDSEIVIRQQLKEDDGAPKPDRDDLTTTARRAGSEMAVAV